MSRPLIRASCARHWLAIAGTVALLLATLLAGIGLLGVSASFLTGTALTFGIAAGFNLFLPSAGIRALTLARILCRYGEKLVGHQATLGIARELRVRMFARMLALSAGQLSRLRTGDLIARLLGDVDAVDGLLVRALGPLLALLAASLVVAAAAFALDPVLGGCIALASAMCVLSLARARHGPAEAEALARQRGALRAQLHELFEGAADLAAMEAGARWLSALEAGSLALGQRELRRRRRLADAIAIAAAVAAFAWVALLWLVGTAVVDGRLLPSTAAGLAFAALVLFEAWAGAALAWQALQAARASAQRIEALAGQAPALRDPDAPRALPRAGALCLDSVTFAWPGGRPVLEAAQLEIGAGERVAVRGDSGSGKSSLAALALRAVDPQGGAVRWGGTDLREAAQVDWQAKVAWLPQAAPVFAGSLADNLRMGCAGASDARLREALACVRLAEWAEALGGLQAWIGEAGATVSAGQARCIALARALLREAPMLVLDEPTEGLDQATADAVMEGVARWCHGRSVLVLTHARLPPGVVDRELLLRDGRLETAQSRR